jgi:hypothetical protein
MITIEGLTQRQKTIMDLLWGCDSLEQVQTLISALPSSRDQRDAGSLVLIATLESMEQEGQLEEHLAAAKEIIDAAQG